MSDDNADFTYTSRAFNDIAYRNFTLHTDVVGSIFANCAFENAAFRGYVDGSIFQDCDGQAMFEMGGDDVMFQTRNNPPVAIDIPAGSLVDMATGAIV